MEYPVLSPGARLASVRIRDTEGKEIGEVKEWMMDVDEGKVVYVLASISGNEDLTAIPWEKMIADKSKGGYKVDLSPDSLDRAPRISRDNVVNLVEDKGFLDKVFDSFNAKKYWGNPTTGREPKGSEITQRQNIEVSEGKGYDHPDPEKFQ